MSRGELSYSLGVAKPPCVRFLAELRHAWARNLNDACALPAAPVEANAGETARRRHAARLGIGGNANAVIPPGAAQTLLLLAPARIVEGGDGLVETALVIAAVVDRRTAAVRAVRKF